jgi:leucyl/phenylalanyl-tRNA--protein transferase
MTATEFHSLADSAAADRQSFLYRESFLRTVKRYGLGTAYSLRKNGLRNLTPYWRRWLVECVHPQRELPDPHQPFDGNARVGLVYDLSVPTLTEAYRRGMFVGGHFGTLAWLSPPQRCVQFLDEFRMSKRLRRLMRKGQYSVTFDRDFEGVIKACAGRRPGRWHVTWITPRIMRAFADLYDAGFAHSIEVWNAEGELVGGGFGVGLGRIFFGESLFSREDHTSKLAAYALHWHLERWGYVLSDARTASPTMLDMGCRLIPRAEFIHCLAKNVRSGGKPGRWNIEADLNTVADWQPGGNQATAKPPRVGGGAR